MKQASRLPPHNAEAEEGLLASCLIDDGAMGAIQKAIEAGVVANSFFIPVNASIWSALIVLHEQKEPVDEFAVATQLNKRGQLEAVGGVAALSRLAGRVETSTGWQRFALEVVAKHTARKAQSEATKAIERIARGDDLVDVLGETEKAFADLATRAGGKRDSEAEKLAAAIESFHFDPAKVIIKPEPIISFSGKTIFTAGNVSSFLAGKSSGKTSSVTAMAASMMGSHSLDYLGFQGFNPLCQSVLYFDTEQSEYDFCQMQRRIAWRARIENLPDWYHAYYVKPLKTADRFKAIFDRIRKAHKERGCLLVIIDGAVDLVANFNDIEVCNQFVDELLAVTHETKAHIHCTLHTNPGQKRNEHGDKGRGHLGTFLEQRSETILLSTKKRVQGIEEMILDTKDARHGIAESVRIRWNDDKKMLMTFNQESIEVEKDTQTKGKLAVIVAEAYADSLNEFKSYNELIVSLCNVKGWSEKTAKNNITLMKDMGIITETSGLYARA